MGLTGSLNTKSMKLENFVGQSYDTIVSSNQYDYVFVQESKESEDADPGTVLEQKPAAGERVMKGSTVTLVVAQTPGGIQVPNCYGLGEDMAKKELASEGLNNYTVTTISSETVKRASAYIPAPRQGFGGCGPNGDHLYQLRPQHDPKGAADCAGCAWTEPKRCSQLFGEERV